MNKQLDHATEIAQLKAFISELLAIVALRSLWVGAEVGSMAGLLADVVRSAIDADYVLVRLRGEENDAWCEASRQSPSWPAHGLLDDPERLLQLSSTDPASSGIQLYPFGDHERGATLAALSVGLQAEFGYVIVGVRRPGFPEITERLKLQAIVNQALISLQGSARLSEQRRRAVELDRLVAMRTAELAETNEQLRQQIAERQTLQDRLAHANRIATVGQMTAAISHELRQPLASIVASGNAAMNWLSQAPADAEAAKRSLTRLISEGVRAGEILTRTRRLLQNAPPIRSAADLNRLVLEAGELIEPAAAHKGVSVRFELANDLPQVAIDAIQLQQVMINLMSNAVEAAFEGAIADPRVLIRSWLDQDQAVGVTVLDTGPGVPPENLDRLFESFFTTKSSGLGLGLAICRDIIVGHSGRIWVENRKEGGAAFHIWLPLDPCDPESSLSAS